MNLFLKEKIRRDKILFVLNVISIMMEIILKAVAIVAIFIFLALTLCR